MPASARFKLPEPSVICYRRYKVIRMERIGSIELRVLAPVPTRAVADSTTIPVSRIIKFKYEIRI